MNKSPPSVLDRCRGGPLWFHKLHIRPQLITQTGVIHIRFIALPAHCSPIASALAPICHGRRRTLAGIAYLHYTYITEFLHALLRSRRR